MNWKVVAAGNEHELQQQLDELQARLPRVDEHGEIHLVGSISELVAIGVRPQGTLIVAVRITVNRDPPLQKKA